MFDRNEGKDLVEQAKERKMLENKKNTVLCMRENLTEKPIYLLTTKINKLKNPFLRRSYLTLKVLFCFWLFS